MITLLDHETISIEALCIILGAFASAIAVIVKLVLKRRANAAAQCLRILTDITFYRLNEEGVKVWYVRSSATKALEVLGERLQHIIEESDNS